LFVKRIFSHLTRRRGRSIFIIMTENEIQPENLPSKPPKIYTQLRDLGIGRVYIITAAITEARAPSGDILGRLEQI